MQAILAFVPCLIWRFVSKRSGVNMAAIMDAARHCSQAHYLEIREKAIRYVVNQMDRYLLAQREYRTGCMVRIKHIVAKFCCIVGGQSHLPLPLHTHTHTHTHRYWIKFSVISLNS